MNSFVKFIIEHPDEKWNWHSLSYNPNTTPELFLAFPDKPWSLYELAKNPAIPVNIIAPYIKSGDWIDIIHRPNLTINDIVTLTSQIIKCDHWIWSQLSRDKRITFIDIYNNSDLPWNWKVVLTRKDINWDHLLEVLLKRPEIINDIDKLRSSKNVDIPWNFIISILRILPHARFDWRRISRSNVITPEIIKAHPKLPWIWYSISAHPNIPWRMIKETMEGPEKLPWDWRGVSTNPNINTQIITENPDLPWDYLHLSFNQLSYHEKYKRPEWDFGNGFKYFERNDQKLILLVTWACSQWGLPREITGLIIERLW